MGSNTRFVTAFRTAGRRLDVAAGTILFRQGDPAETVYLVESGRLILCRSTPDGTPVTIHVARPDALLAEAALFADHYHCDARAEVASRVIAVRARLMRQRLRQHPGLALELIGMLSGELLDLRARLELRNVRRASDRLLSYLRMRADSESRAVALDRSLKDLASEIGLAPETVYRTLARLQADGLLRRVARRIVLT